MIDANGWAFANTARLLSTDNLLIYRQIDSQKQHAILWLGV